MKENIRLSQESLNDLEHSDKSVQDIYLNDKNSEIYKEVNDVVFEGIASNMIEILGISREEAYQDMLETINEISESDYMTVVFEDEASSSKMLVSKDKTEIIRGGSEKITGNSFLLTTNAVKNLLEKLGETDANSSSSYPKTTEALRELHEQLNKKDVNDTK